jgi:hypothetical protein
MQTLPRDVHVGMKVFDNEHHHIGVVDDFKLSDEDPTRDGPETAGISEERDPGEGSVVRAVAEVFDPNEIPEELRERMLREGYIRLDADGLFAADRYILPEQIASARGDEIMLNVKKDELVKRH